MTDYVPKDADIKEIIDSFVRHRIFHLEEDVESRRITPSSIEMAFIKGQIKVLNDLAELKIILKEKLN